jgi:hypothetical protein
MKCNRKNTIIIPNLSDLSVGQRLIAILSNTILEKWVEIKIHIKIVKFSQGLYGILYLLCIDQISANTSVTFTI